MCNRFVISCDTQPRYTAVAVCGWTSIWTTNMVAYAHWGLIDSVCVLRVIVRWPRRTILLRTNVPAAAHERAAAAHGCTCCCARTSFCCARMYLLLRTNELLRRTDVPAAAHERAAVAHKCTCCCARTSCCCARLYLLLRTNELLLRAEELLLRTKIK